MGRHVPSHGGDAELATALSAQTRQFVRIAGWICVGLGVCVVLFALLGMLVVRFHSFGDAVEGPEAFQINLVFGYLPCTVFALAGILLTLTGRGLVRGRNWARIVLIGFLCLSIAWSISHWALFLIMARGIWAQPGAPLFSSWLRLFVQLLMFGLGAVYIAGWVLTHYLAIRWLCSPGVVAVFCAAPSLE